MGECLAGKVLAEVQARNNRLCSETECPHTEELKELKSWFDKLCLDNQCLPKKELFELKARFDEFLREDRGGYGQVVPKVKAWVTSTFLIRT
jgi:hypothetical protein